jgi:hypothetical protein
MADDKKAREVFRYLSTIDPSIVAVLPVFGQPGIYALLYSDNPERLSLIQMLTPTRVSRFR